MTSTAAHEQPYRDLAPSIPRQRLVIEGIPTRPIDASDVRAFLGKLSVVLDMTLLLEPIAHRSDRFGWAGWVHWETSGAHLYAWEDPLFFSVDIYTCKPFSERAAIEFTTDFFGAAEVVSKGF